MRETERAKTLALIFRWQLQRYINLTPKNTCISTIFSTRRFQKCAPLQEEYAMLLLAINAS